RRGAGSRDGGHRGAHAVGRAGSIWDPGKLSESLSMVAADHRADAGETASVSRICRECGNSGVVLADLPRVVCIPPAERRKAGAVLHRVGVAQYRTTSGPVQIPVDSPRMGVLGIAGDWSD